MLYRESSDKASHPRLVSDETLILQFRIKVGSTSRVLSHPHGIITIFLINLSFKPFVLVTTVKALKTA